MQARTLIILGAAALTACAAPWHKPGGTKAEFEETLGACEAQAQRAVPTVTAYYVSPGSSFISQNCDHDRDRCATYSAVTPPSVNSYDANAAERNQYVRACLFKHGWTDETP